jgi:Zn-dependent protease with chaperone function
MHTLSSVIGIVLTLCIGTMLLKSLRSIHNWSQRRMVQFLILSMPSITLGLGLLCLYHLIDHLCKAVPFWDSVIGTLLPGLMAMITCAAILTSIVRHVLMALFLFHTRKMAAPQLQQVSNLLTQQFHAPPPLIFWISLDRPLAFTSGFRRPIILLSSWMLQYLDPQEIEAVLAHEISHIAHHDYLITSLASLLRDAFFYLPPIRAAYQQIQQEKELRGDEHAISITQHPLALASALAKVWLHTVERPTAVALSRGQHLGTDDAAIRSRIEQLLHTDPQMVPLYYASSSKGLFLPSLSVLFFIIISLIQICIFCSFMLIINCFTI